MSGRDETSTIGVYRTTEDSAEWARGVLAAALMANADWLVVDEIGPLELRHNGGFAFALAPLADPIRIPNAIVIVRSELAGELAERVGRTDTVFVEVTEANRFDIPAQLVRLAQAA